MPFRLIWKKALDRCFQTFGKALLGLPGESGKHQLVIGSAPFLNVAQRSRAVPLDRQTGMLVPFFQIRPKSCVTVNGESHFSASKEKERKGFLKIQAMRQHKILIPFWQLSDGSGVCDNSVYMCFVNLQKSIVTCL